MTIKGIGEELAVEEIRVDPDSTKWTDSDNQSPMNASTDFIQDITIKDRRTGRAQALFVGGLSVALGVATAIILKSTSHAPAEVPGVVFLASAIIGAGIGRAISLLITGIDYKYILNDPDEWAEFQAIEDLVDDDREDQALSALNEIIQSSEDDQKRAAALYLKIKYNLDDPIADYNKLKAEFQDNIYTYLAENLLLETVDNVK